MKITSSFVRNGTIKKPHITIVIPAFNEETYLPECLIALNKQNYPKEKYEIIVVDNNSTDRTAAIAKKYGCGVIKEFQQGYVHALNRGLKEAKGSVIAVTDADSKPDYEWIKTIANSMKDDDVIGLTGLAKFDCKSRTLRYLWNNSYMIFVYLHFFIGKPQFSGFNLAVKKKYVNLMGNISPEYQIGADVHLGLSLKKYGKIKFDKKAIVVTSTRRFQKEAVKTMTKYSSVYFFTVWLRRPFPSKLIPVR
jgi:glycosyltransferase involved in cell wall biosynthesis